MDNRALPLPLSPITIRLIPLHCRCIFAVTVTGLNGRSTRILSTLVPEQGSSRSSWTWRGMRSRSTSVGRGSSASAWHGRDQVRFEGSLPRLRSLVSREHSPIYPFGSSLFFPLRASLRAWLGDRPFSYFPAFDTRKDLRNRIFETRFETKIRSYQDYVGFLFACWRIIAFFPSLFKELFIKCNPLLSLLIISI